MTETIRENERLGTSFIHPKGNQFVIPPCDRDFEVWPIVKALPGDAQIAGYLIRLIEEPKGASDGKTAI